MPAFYNPRDKIALADAAADAADEYRSDAELRAIARQRELQALRNAGRWSAELAAELNDVCRHIEEYNRGRFAARRQAQRQAELARETDRRQAEANAQRDEVRQYLASAYPGLSGDALEAAVDQVLIEEAAAHQDRVLAEKRQRYGL